MQNLNEKTASKKGSAAAAFNAARGSFNEHMFSYYLNGNKWIDDEHEKQANKYKAILDSGLGPEEARIQGDRAHAQAQAFMEHARSLGYSGIAEIHNTARSSIEQATGIDATAQENPSDIIVKFKKKPRGAAHGFLGASLKSSSKKIGFHNGGAGTIDSELGTNLTDIGKEHHALFQTQNNLPAEVGKRAAIIKGEGEEKRNNPLYDKALKAADDTHRDARDHLFEHYSGMGTEDLRSHFINTFLKASNESAIPWVKVQGKGGESARRPASGHIEASHDNPAYHAIKNAKEIRVEKSSGSAYMRVMADGQKAFSIQVKHNSTPMASSIKVLGQP